MKTPKAARWALIKVLKATKKQFYDDQGNPISTSDYVDLLLLIPPEELKAYEKKLKQGGK